MTKFYVTAKNGVKQMVKTSPLTLQKQKLQITTKALSAGQRITLKNPGRQITTLNVAIWGAKNGQNDIRWKKVAFNQDTNSCSFKWYGSATDETGLYNVHIYGIDAVGNQFFLGKTTFKRAAAKVTSEIRFVKNSSAGTITEKITDLSANYRISEVLAAVWTKKNGQDDLKWYPLQQASDGTWRLKINKKDHNAETGVYYIHTYVKDINGTNVRVSTDTVKL